MVKIHIFQLKISQVLYLNLDPINDMIKMLEREQIIIDESVFSPNYIIRNLPKILYQSTLCECHVK